MSEPTAREKQLLSLAEALVPRGRAWECGQAVIEFGVLRCTARKPTCECCPLRRLLWNSSDQKVGEMT